MTTWRACSPCFALVTSACALAAVGAGCGSSYTATPAPTAPAAAVTTAAPAAAPAPVAAVPPTPTIPPKTKGENPFKGAHLYSNPYGQAATQAQAWEGSRPADAKLIAKIAKQPAGWWMGEWSGEIEPAVHNLGNATNASGMVPVIVVYNIPNRDCGQYSKGGSTSSDAYKKWIHDFASGAGSFRMIVVLEPDALGLLTKCLSPADQKARLALIHDAVKTLEATPGVSVYLDAGHAKWIAADDMAKRLKGAGIDDADGFALNTSNYIATDENVKYGKAISAALGGKHFIVDTGRNGNGATPDLAWCNPKGRALGSAPTTDTGDPVVDAYFWTKPPGESDGECNGGPKAGEFWPEEALELVKNAKW
jgi:endoglucanase